MMQIGTVVGTVSGGNDMLDPFLLGLRVYQPREWSHKAVLQKLELVLGRGT